MFKVVYIYIYIYIFFFLISAFLRNTGTISRHNPHKQKLFGVLSDFQDYKGVLRAKRLRIPQTGRRTE